MLVLDAVRVARNYDRSVPRVYCSVTHTEDGAWSVRVTNAYGGEADRGERGRVSGSGRADRGTVSGVVDPIEVCLCDKMRTSPPNRWGEVYAEATRRAGSFANGAKVHARGVEFWRVYYGVPDMSVAEMLEAHEADKPRWDPALVIAPKRTQKLALEYRERVRSIVCDAIDALYKYLRKNKLKLDASLVRSAFSLVRNSVDAVLVTKPGSPLSGAMYPAFVLDEKHVPDPLKRTVRLAASRARDSGENMLGENKNNARVLVVKDIEDKSALEALLAHEIAHAITVPIWQPNNNHPPAFVEFETLTARALNGSL